MMTILLSVTDNELLTGELFGILLILTGVAIFFGQIVNFIRSDTKEKKETIPYISAGAGIIGLGVYFYDIEHNLRTESVYVNGVTIGFCNRGENGRGIEFEYYVNGVRYTNCNSYSRDVLVPGGKYLVRVSSKHPDIGRIDYEKRVE
jgi:hypothetical protein